MISKNDCVERDNDQHDQILTNQSSYHKTTSPFVVKQPLMSCDSFFMMYCSFYSKQSSLSSKRSITSRKVNKKHKSSSLTSNLLCLTVILLSISTVLSSPLPTASSSSRTKESSKLNFVSSSNTNLNSIDVENPLISTNEFSLHHQHHHLRHHKHHRSKHYHHPHYFHNHQKIPYKDSNEMMDTSASLSIVTPLDILRQNILLEIQKRRQKEARLKLVKFNKEFLEKIG